MNLQFAPSETGIQPLTGTQFHTRRTLTLIATLLVVATNSALAVSCTTQGAMQPADRDALVAAAAPMAASLASQDLNVLQSLLLPAISGEWDGIRNVAQGAAPLFKGGNVHWRSIYMLDATELKAPADTEFFCTNADNTLTVTVNLRSLPPGRYGLMLGDSTSTPLAGQLGLILATDSAASNQWKLGGLFVREGALDGHDPVAYWTQARSLAAKKSASTSWAAWYSYDLARLLELPVDFISTPNLEKLNREQSLVGSNPAESLPLTIAGSTQAESASGTGKSWKITNLHVDTTLHTADLGITYEGAGLSEPVAAKAEAVAVMSGLLKLHPDLRENFHGLWAYAEKDGKRTYAIEVAMRDIP
jgi:hypothetical protein